MNTDAQDALDDFLNGFEQWKSAKMGNMSWRDEDEAFARWIEAGPLERKELPVDDERIRRLLDSGIDLWREAKKLARTKPERREAKIYVEAFKSIRDWLFED